MGTGRDKPTIIIEIIISSVEIMYKGIFFVCVLCMWGVLQDSKIILPLSKLADFMEMVRGTLKMLD